MTWSLHALRATGLIALCLPSLCWAGEWDLSVETGMESRWFTQSARGTSDATRLTFGLTIEPEAIYSWNDGDDQLTGEIFFRWDSEDMQRKHGDVRVASYLHQGDGFDLLAGIDKVFWGKAESVHLVDIINQTDVVESVDGEAKLGQPMVNMSFYQDWGTVDIFVLPYFRERRYHADNKPLSGAAPIHQTDATYDSSQKQWHPDFALRYSATFDDIDFGLSHFNGTGREPRLIASTTGFIPHYDQIDQTGLDVQYTTGSWLWKLEAMSRSGQGKRFRAAVGGFEYTSYGVFDSDVDLGFLVEGQYDGRDITAPSSSAENDFFSGIRLVANDTQDSTALVGAAYDVKDGTTFLSIEAKRRIADNYEVKAEGRFFVDVASDNSIKGIERDDHIILRVARFL